MSMRSVTRLPSNADLNAASSCAAAGAASASTMTIVFARIGFNIAAPVVAISVSVRRRTDCYLRVVLLGRDALMLGESGVFPVAVCIVAAAAVLLAVKC